MLCAWLQVLGAVLALPVFAGCGSDERAAEPERVEEVRWLAVRAPDRGRIVRVATANSSSVRPEEVRVRMDKAEVGLTLRLRVPQIRLQDLRLHCVEANLSEPVGARRLVDDGGGPLNPCSVSLEAAERSLADHGTRCVRVPAVP